MKAQVKKYDPTQYNFENFANTMNKNYAIERSQNSQGGAFGAPTMPGNVAVHADNPINLGSATNSQTLGNFGFNSILSGFKKSLDGYSLGKQMDVNDVPPLPHGKGGGSVSLEESTSSPDVSLGGGVNGSAATTLINQKTESPRAVKTVETPTVTQGDVKESFDLSWLDALESGLNPVSKLSFEEWQSAYSVNPAEEYKYAQAQLDYEFKTWMSDYGARAEQLYQMGLANSGVSDIYGANAYSAYIQSSMALKREQIKLQQENKKNYQTYLDEKKSAANTRIGTAYAAYEGSYTPEGSQGIYNSLIGQGMSASEAAEVIRRLDAHYNTMPEDSRPDKIENAAKITEAFDWMLSQYNNSNGTINVEGLIKQVKALYGEDIGAQAAEKFMPFATVEEVDSATIINDAAVRIATTIFTDTETGTSTYTGSESQKNYIRQLMQLAEYKDVAPYVEKIIAKMDENLKSTLDAVVEDVAGSYGEAVENQNWLSNPLTSTVANYMANLDQYKQQYGVNSQEYKDILAAASASIKGYILNATDDANKLAEAGNWLGVDFSGMDDSQRLKEMINQAGDLRKNGYLTDEDYNAIFGEFVNGEITSLKEENHGAAEFNEATDIAAYLKEAKDNKRLTDDEYNKYMTQLATSVISSAVKHSSNDAVTFINLTNGQTVDLRGGSVRVPTQNEIDSLTTDEKEFLRIYGVLADDSGYIWIYDYSLNSYSKMPITSKNNTYTGDGVTNKNNEVIYMNTLLWYALKSKQKDMATRNAPISAEGLETQIQAEYEAKMAAEKAKEGK